MYRSDVSHALRHARGRGVLSAAPSHLRAGHSAPTAAVAAAATTAPRHNADAHLPPCRRSMPSMRGVPTLAPQHRGLSTQAAPSDQPAPDAPNAIVLDDLTPFLPDRIESHCLDVLLRGRAWVLDPVSLSPPLPLLLPAAQLAPIHRRQVADIAQRVGGTELAHDVVGEGATQSIVISYVPQPQSVETTPIAPQVSPSPSLPLTPGLPTGSIDDLCKRLAKQVESWDFEVRQLHTPPSVRLFVPIGQTLRALKSAILAEPRSSQVPAELAHHEALQTIVHAFMRWRTRHRHTMEDDQAHAFRDAEMTSDNRLLEQLLFVCTHTTTTAPRTGKETHRDTATSPVPDTRRMNAIFRSFIFGVPVSEWRPYKPGDIFGHRAAPDPALNQDATNGTPQQQRVVHNYYAPAAYHREFQCIPSETVWVILCKGYTACNALLDVKNLLLRVIPQLYGDTMGRVMDLRARCRMLDAVAWGFVGAAVPASQRRHSLLWVMRQIDSTLDQQQRQQGLVNLLTRATTQPLLHAHEAILSFAVEQADFDLLKDGVKRLTDLEHERVKQVNLLADQTAVVHTLSLVFNYHVMVHIVRFYSNQVDRAILAETNGFAQLNVLTPDQAATPLLDVDGIADSELDLTPRGEIAAVPLDGAPERSPLLPALHRRLAEVWSLIAAHEQEVTVDEALLGPLAAALIKCEQAGRRSPVLPRVIGRMKRGFDSSSGDAAAQARLFVAACETQATAMLQTDIPDADAIKAIIADLRARGMKPTSRLYNNLLDAYLSLLRFSRKVARDPFRHLEPGQTAESLHLRSALEYFQCMHEVLHEMSAGGVDAQGNPCPVARPDWYTYQLLVHAHRLAMLGVNTPDGVLAESDAPMPSADHLPSLLALYEDMLHSLSTPPTKLLDLFLASIARMETVPDLSIQLYRSMLQNGEIDADGNRNAKVLWPGVRPSSLTFSVIIGALTRHRHVDAALHCYALMMKLVRAQQADEDTEVAAGEALRPSSRMYYELMRALVLPVREEMTPHLGLVATLFADLVSFRLPLSMPHFSLLLKAMSRLGDTDGVWNVVQYLLKEHAHLVPMARGPRDHHLECAFREDAMNCLVASGNIERARAVHDALQPTVAHPYESKDSIQYYWLWPFGAYMRWLSLAPSVEMFRAILALMPRFDGDPRRVQITNTQWAMVWQTFATHDPLRTAYRTWKLDRPGPDDDFNRTFADWRATNPPELVDPPAAITESVFTFEATQQLLYELRRGGAVSPNTWHLSTEELFQRYGRMDEYEQMKKEWGWREVRPFRGRSHQQAEADARDDVSDAIESSMPDAQTADIIDRLFESRSQKQNLRLHALQAEASSEVTLSSEVADDAEAVAPTTIEDESASAPVATASHTRRRDSQLLQAERLARMEARHIRSAVQDPPTTAAVPPLSQYLSDSSPPMPWARNNRIEPHQALLRDHIEELRRNYQQDIAEVAAHTQPTVKPALEQRTVFSPPTVASSVQPLTEPPFTLTASPSRSFPSPSFRDQFLSAASASDLASIFADELDHAGLMPAVRLVRLFSPAEFMQPPLLRIDFSGTSPAKPSNSDPINLRSTKLGRTIAIDWSLRAAMKTTIFDVVSYMMVLEERAAAADPILALQPSQAVLDFFYDSLALMRALHAYKTINLFFLYFASRNALLPTLHAFHHLVRSRQHPHQVELKRDAFLSGCGARAHADLMRTFRWHASRTRCDDGGHSLSPSTSMISELADQYHAYMSTWMTHFRPRAAVVEQKAFTIFMQIAEMNQPLLAGVFLTRLADLVKDIAGPTDTEVASAYRQWTADTEVQAQCLLSLDAYTLSRVVTRFLATAQPRKSSGLDHFATRRDPLGGVPLTRDDLLVVALASRVLHHSSAPALGLLSAVVTLADAMPPVLHTCKMTREEVGIMLDRRWKPLDDFLSREDVRNEPVYAQPFTMLAAVQATMRLILKWEQTPRGSPDSATEAHVTGVLQRLHHLMQVLLTWSPCSPELRVHMRVVQARYLVDEAFGTPVGLIDRMIHCIEQIEYEPAADLGSDERDHTHHSLAQLCADVLLEIQVARCSSRVGFEAAVDRVLASLRRLHLLDTPSSTLFFLNSLWCGLSSSTIQLRCNEPAGAFRYLTSIVSAPLVRLITEPGRIAMLGSANFIALMRLARHRNEASLGIMDQVVRAMERDDWLSRELASHTGTELARVRQAHQTLYTELLQFFAEARLLPQVLAVLALMGRHRIESDVRMFNSLLAALLAAMEGRASDPGAIAPILSVVTALKHESLKHRDDPATSHQYQPTLETFSLVLRACIAAEMPFEQAVTLWRDFTADSGFARLTPQLDHVKMMMRVCARQQTMRLDLLASWLLESGLAAPQPIHLTDLAPDSLSSVHLLHQPEFIVVFLAFLSQHGRPNESRRASAILDSSQNPPRVDRKLDWAGFAATQAKADSKNTGRYLDTLRATVSLVQSIATTQADSGSRAKPQQAQQAHAL